MPFIISAVIISPTWMKSVSDLALSYNEILAWILDSRSCRGIVNQYYSHILILHQVFMCVSCKNMSGSHASCTAPLWPLFPFQALGLLGVSLLSCWSLSFPVPSTSISPFQMAHWSERQIRQLGKTLDPRQPRPHLVRLSLLIGNRLAEDRVLLGLYLRGGLWRIGPRTSVQLPLCGIDWAAELPLLLIIAALPPLHPIYGKRAHRMAPLGRTRLFRIQPKQCARKSQAKVWVVEGGSYAQRGWSSSL